MPELSGYSVRAGRQPPVKCKASRQPGADHQPDNRAMAAPGAQAGLGKGEGAAIIEQGQRSGDAALQVMLRRGATGAGASSTDITPMLSVLLPLRPKEITRGTRSGRRY